MISFFPLVLLVAAAAAAPVVQWSPVAKYPKSQESTSKPKIAPQQDIEKLQPRPIPEIWKWCKEEPSLIKNVEVLFENYPLVPGTNFNVIIRGDVLEPLDEVTVKTRITVGGLLSIVDTQDLCKGPKKRCPYTAGHQEQRLTYPITITLFGNVYTKAIMYAGQKPIACIDLGPLVTKSAKVVPALIKVL